MYRLVKWDMEEIIGDVRKLYPKLFQLFPNFREVISDLIALSLRDRSMGTNDSLDNFIELELGAEYAYLALFFRANSIRWYREVVAFISLVACEFDEFTIEDIVQHTPNTLHVKVWVTYHYEGSSLLGF